MSQGRGRWRLIGILLLAFILRVHTLNVQELRGDEAFGYFFSQQSVEAIVQATLALREPHPVGSYLVQKAWTRLAGETVFALRFPSVWCGTLAVALLYALVCALGLSRSVAEWTALMLAVSPYGVWHSQDARMYTMSSALTLLSMWLMLGWARYPQPQRWWGYVITTWMALHIHYFTAWIILAQNVFVLWKAWQEWRFRARLGPWIGAQTTVALLYAPWLWAAWPILRDYQGNGSSPPLLEMLWRSFSVFIVGETTPTVERYVYAGVGSLLVASGFWHLVRERAQGRPAALLLALYMGLPMGMIWLASRSRPLFNERYLVIVVPAFYTALAVTLAWLGQLPHQRTFRSRAAHIMLIVVVMGGLGLGVSRSLYHYFYDPAFDKTVGWRELAVALNKWPAGMLAEQVRIAENYPDPTLWYYYRGPLAHVVLPPAAHDREGAREVVADLVASNVAWVLLPVYHSAAWDDEDIAAAALAEHFTPVWEAPVAVWHLRLYARPLPEAWQQVSITYLNGLILEAFQIQPTHLVPGSIVVVHSRWRAPLPRGEPLKAFFHLTPAQGPPVPLAQCDPRLRAERGTWVVSCAFSVPSSLTAGRYRVLAGLYIPNRAGAPRVLTAEGKDAVGLMELTLPGQKAQTGGEPR